MDMLPDEILKLMASGGGVSSGILIYLVWSMRKELTNLNDSVHKLAERMTSTITTQEFILKEIEDLRSRVGKAEERCFNQIGRK